MTVSRFHIAGMDCSAEEQLVRMKLAELDGINRVEFRLDQRDVVVDHNTSTDTITAALSSLDLGVRHVDDTSAMGEAVDPQHERKALIAAFLLNAVLFVGELTAGFISRSLGLVADSLDMGADASVYALAIAAVGTAATRKKQLARYSGYLQIGLAAIGSVEIVRRFFGETELPDPKIMVALSALALSGNVVTLLLLQRVRTNEAHMQASWIFTTNDVKVNALVIVAAIGVALTDSAVPDLAVGAIVFVVVVSGARRILKLSR